MVGEGVGKDGSKGVVAGYDGFDDDVVDGTKKGWKRK